jgi:hypothetical protein
MELLDRRSKEKIEKINHLREKKTLRRTAAVALEFV